MNSWTIEDLLRIKIPSDISISRDGQQLAYIVKSLAEDGNEYQRKVYLQFTDRTEEPIQLTQGKSNDSYPKFSPDGKWLAFLSDRLGDGDEDEDKNEGDAGRHLYLLPLHGGEARCFSKDLGPVYDYDFAPDGSSLFVMTDVYQSQFEKEREKAWAEQKRDFKHEERSVVPRRICRLDIPSGTVSTLYDRDYGLVEICAGPDPDVIAFTTNRTGLGNDFDKTNLYILERPADASADTWRARPLAQRKGACHSPRFSPDGRYVAYIAPRFELSEHSQSEVWVVPSHHAGEAVNLTERLGYVGDAMEVGWLSLSKLVFKAEQGMSARLESAVDVEAALAGTGGKIEPVISTPGVVEVFAVCASRQQLAYIAQTAEQPLEIFLWSGTDYETKQVSHWQTEWSDKYRAVVRDYQWQSGDGTTIEGLLALPGDGGNPESGSDGKWPMIVDIHGGPAWHTERAFLQYVNFHWLCQLGYAVFLPNYRGGLGYGEAYIEANHHDLGGVDYHDIMSGVNALIADGTIDEQRMGVTGGSYGGYMTNWIIGHDTRFKAAVSEFGIWNLMTDFGSSNQRCWEVMYLDRYWEREDLYLERSPARYVSQIHTPTLIIHGDDDDNTFIANSKEMYNALLEAGKQVEFIHYPREGHGLQEPRHKADELQRISDWFLHFIPTEHTKRPVKPLTWGAVKKNLEARCIDWRVTSEYQHMGKEFKNTIQVELEVKPVNVEESYPSIVLGNPEDDMVMLRWQGTEPFQRNSIFGAADMPAIGWTVAETDFIATGKQNLYIFNPVKLLLLFSADWMEYEDLSDTVLQIGDASFSLVTESA